MIFNSKQTVDGTPVWEVDTDTQTVRHRSPKTGKTERYVFHTDQIRYYLHHIEDKRPDLLHEIVDKGGISWIWMHSSICWNASGTAMCWTA